MSMLSSEGVVLYHYFLFFFFGCVCSLGPGLLICTDHYKMNDIIIIIIHFLMQLLEYFNFLVIQIFLLCYSLFMVKPIVWIC